jgi:multiple sugar transport system substrate-binding protein
MNCCEVIKKSGVCPIALGVQGPRWGIGLWFDYLLLNTAGGDFRERLMWGKESWESQEVYHVFEIWSEMIKKGYFNDDLGSIDPNQITTAYVAQGKCAMVLNGPWCTNNFMTGSLQLVAGVDFDSFTFPSINPNVKPSSEGCIEGWVVNPNCKNYDAVKKVLSYYGSKEVQDLRTEMRLIPSPRKDMTYKGYDEGAKRIAEMLRPQYQDLPLHQNFELATVSEMQDSGLNGLIEFINNPSDYKKICAGLERSSRQVFDK